MARAKFKVGDTVFFTERCPEFLRVKKRRRKVARIYYDKKRQCSYYILGANHKGENADYPYRSYMLKLDSVGHRPRKVLEKA